ncbi:MAG: helix-turn-helix transcriptional regulator [Candidatus Gastranaerophilales bacterium]
MSKVKKLFGLRIKELRKEKEITQDYFAEMIEIATRNLSKIETGKCFPSPEKLEKIATSLGCEIKDLFDFEHHKENDDLMNEIIKSIQPISRSRLQDIYKITKALIK